MDRKVFYSNASGISTNLVECQMIFDTVLPKHYDNNLNNNSLQQIIGTEIADSLTVIMSLQHFKMFVEAAKKQLEIYEQQNGEIVLPSEINIPLAK